MVTHLVVQVVQVVLVDIHREVQVVLVGIHREVLVVLEVRQVDTQEEQVDSVVVLMEVSEEKLATQEEDQVVLVVASEEQEVLDSEVRVLVVSVDQELQVKLDSGVATVDTPVEDQELVRVDSRMVGEPLEGPDSLEAEEGLAMADLEDVEGPHLAILVVDLMAIQETIPQIEEQAIKYGSLTLLRNHRRKLTKHFSLKILSYHM